MSFYKLPPPWNPGYAIPKSVMAEPPERGVFVTQWLPRGTIPQLLPDYLAEPVRGTPRGVKAMPALSGAGDHRVRGVRDRSTQQRYPIIIDPVPGFYGPRLRRLPTITQGSLSGTTLDGNVFTDNSLSHHSLSGDTLDNIGGPRTSFSKYGQKVARDLMARMRGLPNDQRGKVLKRTLAAIDKTLPARAEKYALEEQKRGASPQVALERGIARGVSEGVVTELAAVGRGARRSPQAGSPRGLGRTHQGLGAIADVVRSLKTSAMPALQIATQASPQPGQCSSDGQFIWVSATASTPGHWERLRAGQSCTQGAGSGVGPSRVNDQRGSTEPPLQAPPTAGDPNAGNYRAVQVGPFKFPADQDWSAATFWGKTLPPDWQAFIRRVITKDANSRVGTLGPILGMSPDTMVNNQYIGNATRVSRPGWNPVARVTHPDSGKDYGIFLAWSSRYPDKPNDANNPAILNVIWAPISKSLLERIWDWIQKLVGKIVDVVGDALDAVKDATCELLQKPGIDQSAVAAAAAAPSPATAGAAAGVVIGQKLCGGAKDPGLPQLPQSGGGMGLLVPVAIGGGILLVYALTR